MTNQLANSTIVEYRSVSEAYTQDFINAVFEAYETLQWNQQYNIRKLANQNIIKELPPIFYGGVLIDEMFEAFQTCIDYIEESIALEEFNVVGFGELNDDERDIVFEIRDSYLFTYGHEFISDVFEIWDGYNLFYLSSDAYYSDEVVDFSKLKECNSPLQDVW